MKRLDEKFNGTLTDKELYWIEDGLNLLRATDPKTRWENASNKAIDDLIDKLYKFEEA